MESPTVPSCVISPTVLGANGLLGYARTMTKTAGGLASRLVPAGLALAFALVALACIWIFSAVALLAFGGWGIVGLAVAVVAGVGVAVLVRRR